MKKLFYPALFQIARNGSFQVSFPDIPECHTQGEDLAQAYEKAVEALSLVLAEYDKEGRPLPDSSDPRAIAGGQDLLLVVIEFDMLAYKKRTNSRAVKKTLSIPEWMNEAAISINLNFSQVLQEALLGKILEKKSSESI